MSSETHALLSRIYGLDVRCPPNSEAGHVYDFFMDIRIKLYLLRITPLSRFMSLPKAESFSENDNGCWANKNRHLLTLHIVTARIHRIGEGNIFSLFTPGRGGHQPWMGEGHQPWMGEGYLP